MANKLSPDAQVPVLCYHRVLERGEPAPTPSMDFCTHTWSDQFARHLDIMADMQMTTINHEDLIDAMEGSRPLPPRPVMLDFDDNRMATFKTAWPLMREHGFVGTVFVITDLADGLELPHLGTRADFPAMGWRHLRELQAAGWAIGGHTRSHFWLKDLKEEKGLAEVEKEVAIGRQRTEAQMGRPIRSFAYPGGSYDEQVEGVVMGCFRTARLWHLEVPTAYVTPETDPYRLPSANINCATDITALTEWLGAAAR